MLQSHLAAGVRRNKVPKREADCIVRVCAWARVCVCVCKAATLQPHARTRPPTIQTPLQPLTDKLRVS